MKSLLQNGFTRISNNVVRDPNIPLREKGLYVLLASYANNDTGETTVSVRKMADECGVDQSSVRRTLDKLISMGLIRRTRRGKNESWITTLLK
jgi:DNA-binding MarR family transcriptional regulator